MTELETPFGSPRAVLLDARGSGLRLTWHSEEGIAVLSLWREDRCVGTFRATPEDVVTIISVLSQALASSVRTQVPEVAETA